KHLGTPDRLDMLLVRNGDRLTGVAPLTRAGAGPAHWLAPRHRLLGTGTVGSDYLDLIVEDAAEQETVAALARHFQRHRTTVELGQLPHGTSTAGKVAQRLASDGWTVVENLTHVCPVVDLADQTWDSFVASLGRSHRQNVRRRLRKLEERFAVELERVESEAMLEEAFEILVRLHRQRWDARGGSEALDDPAVVGFHRELTRLALARGWLRLYVLRLDGRAVAALYGFRYGHRFLYYQSGFDEAFADLSVGLAIMALAIRSAIDEGLREYDLLHGAEPYKFHWATSVRELSRLELYPPSFEALLRRTTRRAVRGAKSRIRKWLAATAQPAGRLADRGSCR
ncbi:MAG TPA: GNAT family N-acetyltransferase, partial [Thermoanaerobaculia bacterium]|nr:GNAT family N-acetyltransferase [Thermoanaerobaculia bacterium]